MWWESREEYNERHDAEGIGVLALIIVTLVAAIAAGIILASVILIKTFKEYRKQHLQVLENKPKWYFVNQYNLSCTIGYTVLSLACDIVGFLGFNKFASDVSIALWARYIFNIYFAVIAIAGVMLIIAALYYKFLLWKADKHPRKARSRR